MLNVVDEVLEKVNSDEQKIKIKVNPDDVEFAKNNGYDIIWFYEDIDQVYLRNSVVQSEKTKKAKQFVSHNRIDDVSAIDLSQIVISRNKSSNILVVIDKYLKRK